jgi:hypothetical protein
MACSPLFKKGTSLSDQRFKQKPLHGCSGCGQDFTSIYLLDAHRVGVYQYTHEQGLELDPPREDGRRCLGVEEMEAKGWKLNERGRWIDPVRVQAARESFARAA